MKIIDFTSSRWGHSLHGHTFSPVKDFGSKLSRYFERKKSIRRYSAMVHSSNYPKIGDMIIYKSENGKTIGEIYHIEYCGDPQDMFKLFFLVRP